MADGQLAGTVGKKQRVEAVKVNLTGELSVKYDIYYRVHVANYGWLSWTKNGETAGSTGFGCAIEGIEIKLYPKDSSDAPEMGRSALTKEDIPVVVGQAHVSGDGWKDVQNAEQLLGTTGESKGVEAVALSVESGENQFTGGIEYQAHVQDIGWQGKTNDVSTWKKDGENAGTVGMSKRLEALQIQLTGTDAEKYDVYYRVHAEDYGWLNWAKNGEISGTAGCGKSTGSITDHCSGKRSKD